MQWTLKIENYALSIFCAPARLYLYSSSYILKSIWTKQSGLNVPFGHLLFQHIFVASSTVRFMITF